MSLFSSEDHRLAAFQRSKMSLGVENALATSANRADYITNDTKGRAQRTCIVRRGLIQHQHSNFGVLRQPPRDHGSRRSQPANDAKIKRLQWFIGVGSCCSSREQRKHAEEQFAERIDPSTLQPEPSHVLG
jgi:hypothetical protein